MIALAQDYDAYHTPHSVRRQYVPEATDWKPLLDRRSEPHPILNALMDETLTRIALVSDGAVTQLKQMLKGSRAEPGAPSSDLAATLDELGGRYMACKTHRRRLAVIKEAQDTADRMRYSPSSTIVMRGTMSWRVMVGTDPRPSRIVAADYHCSLRAVGAARKEFGRQ